MNYSGLLEIIFIIGISFVIVHAIYGAKGEYKKPYHDPMIPILYSMILSFFLLLGYIFANA